MPRYKIIEYRGVNIVGLAASGTSTIYATDIEDARLSAQCTNYPKGQMGQSDEGIHIKGDVDDGNVSIVIPIEDPEVIEYDIRTRLPKSNVPERARVYTSITATFLKSRHMIQKTQRLTTLCHRHSPTFIGNS